MSDKQFCEGLFWLLLMLALVLGMMPVFWLMRFLEAFLRCYTAKYDMRRKQNFEDDEDA